MDRRTTVKDVAKRAGVSATTVSYVLNDNPKQSIPPETKERVLKAAQELDYVRDNAARILKNNESKCVGVVIGKTLALERFAITVQGIRNLLAERGYTILLCSPEHTGGAYADYLENYFQHHLDGLIYLGRDNKGPSQDELDVIVRRRIPAVAFDCKFAGEGMRALDFDYRGGARALGRAIAERSGGKVLYLRPEADNPQEQERQAGLIDGLADRPGIELSIRSFPISNEALPRFDRDFDTIGGPFNPELDAFFDDALPRAAAGFDGGDCVVSSWGTYVDRIERTLDALDPKPLLATMAEPPLFARPRSGFLYCRMNHYEAGRRAARTLLDALAEGDEVVRRAPEQLNIEVRGI